MKAGGLELSHHNRARGALITNAKESEARWWIESTFATKATHNVAVPLPDGAVNCRIEIISKYSDEAEANRRSKQPYKGRGKQRGRK